MVGRFKRWLQRMRFEYEAGDILGLRQRMALHVDILPPPSPPGDPYAWKPVPRTSPPRGRSGAVAVAEPDDHR